MKYLTPRNVLCYTVHIILEEARYCYMRMLVMNMEIVSEYGMMTSVCAF